MVANGMMQRFTTALHESARSKGFQFDSAPAAEGARNPQLPWDANDLMHAIQTVGRGLGDEFYGLAAQRCLIGTSQLGIEILMLSPNLREGLERCCRLYGLVTKGVEFKLYEKDEVAALELHVSDTRLDRKHFLPEWHALRWHRICQWIIGEDIPLLGVDFAHAAQSAPAEYMQIFGAPCHFQQPVSRIRFARRYLDKRVVRRPADLETALSYSSVNPVLAEAAAPTWRDGLKVILKKRLARSTTMPTLEELADEFGVCSQTLRRRLRAENYSYRMLKAETRREIALDGMRDDRLTLAQISLMAGFAETNGLVRAMKSWTGLTPSQYRRIATDQADGQGGEVGDRRPAAEVRSDAPIA